MGHNFGAHNAHWCGWPGGPIDNCPRIEGPCYGYQNNTTAQIGTLISYWNQNGDEDDGSCKYLDGICETCQDGFVIENDDDNDGICNEGEIDSVLNLSNPDRSLIKVTNLLGQEVEITLNTPMLFIYDNGSVEKQFKTE
jgi:hypothetical protein